MRTFSIVKNAALAIFKRQSIKKTAKSYRDFINKLEGKGIAVTRIKRDYTMGDVPMLTVGSRHYDLHGVISNTRLGATDILNIVNRTLKGVRAKDVVLSHAVTTNGVLNPIEYRK